MAREFKSRTFVLGSPEGEELENLKADIELLSTLEPSKWDAVLSYAKEFIIAKTKREELRVLNNLMKSESIPRHVALAAYRFIHFFFRKFTDETTRDDTPKEILADITPLGFTAEDISTIEKFLALIKQDAKWYRDYKLKESFRKGLFPYLKGIGTTVELRGVFNREIRYGENAEEYEEEVELEEKSATVPVISVAITFDSGYPDRVCFQATQDSTRWLIEELKAALHKVKMLENHVKSNNV